MGEDNVGLSTDDMMYDNYFFNNKVDALMFPYDNIACNIRNLLERYFPKEVVQKIMYDNAYKKLCI